MVYCSANYRLSSLLYPETYVGTNESLMMRVTKVSLQFLQMYAPLHVMITGIGIGVKSCVFLKQALHDYCIGHKRASAKNIVKVACLCASLAAMIICPLASSVAIHTAQMFSESHQCCLYVQQGHYEAAVRAGLRMLHSAIYIAALLYATPELLALSLLSQAILELKGSLSQFSQGHYLEGCANLLLAVIRIHQAMSYAQTTYRNWWGAQLSQKELDLFLKEIRFRDSYERVINFENFLKRNGFSSYLHRLSFKKHTIYNIVFKNVSFNKCNFNDANFCRSHFVNSIFKNCCLERSQMIDSIFQHVSFLDCNLESAEFTWSQFLSVQWQRCNLMGVIFNEASFQNSIFKLCKLLETSFFKAQVRTSKLSFCDLTDCLLFDTCDKFALSNCSTYKITRPIVGLPWNFERIGIFSKMIHQAINECGGIAFRFHTTPRYVNILLLDKEVQAVFNQNLKREQLPNQSLPQYILDKAPGTSEVAKIKALAQEVTGYLDALIIPGGADVDPQFYGAKREPLTYTEENHCRSLLEFAMIGQAQQQHIFTFGVCRGSQLINIFLGGTLKQHVAGQVGITQQLSFYPQTTSLASQIGNEILQGDSIVTLSMHHQAMDVIGKGLEKLIVYKGIPKLLVSDDGNFVLSQMHPEMYLHNRHKNADIYKNNRSFFVYLVRRAAEKKAQKIV